MIPLKLSNNLVFDKMDGRLYLKGRLECPFFEPNKIKYSPKKMLLFCEVRVVSM